MISLPWHVLSRILIECVIAGPGGECTQWILVFVAAITAGFICWQAWETRRSAQASAEAAGAALLNAQAVIRSERPWLVVTFLPDKEKLGSFRFSCRNKGKTPAKVISMSAKLDIVASLDKLVIPPDYSSAVQMPDLRLIVPDKSFRIGPGVNPELFLLNHLDKRPSVNDRRAFLVYYGNVIYRDTFYQDGRSEGVHETCWCFVYGPSHGEKFDRANLPNQAGTFVRSGPAEEYNQYT